MKTLFLTAIALVIPLFFLLIFVLGTYNRLAVLRSRCRSDAGGVADAGHDDDAERRQRAVEQYNAARSTFPASVVARLFGFEPQSPARSTLSAGGAPSASEK
jgi:hypothetical protein